MNPPIFDRSKTLEELEEKDRSEHWFRIFSAELHLKNWSTIRGCPAISTKAIFCKRSWGFLQSFGAPIRSW